MFRRSKGGRTTMKKILFVCTGNTCRSSMAEGIFKNLLKEAKNPMKGIEVVSAGTAVFTQEPANQKAIKVMEERGIDISSHRSQPIGKELLESADLILTMTQSHREQILRMDPQLKNKVYTLLEFIQDKEGQGRILDITD